MLHVGLHVTGNIAPPKLRSRSRGLRVDCNVIKRNFYSACNSIFCHSHRNNELVKVQLVKSLCLPLSTYCMGVIEIQRYKIKELGICWNECFRKKFNSHRWDSLKELQWFQGELPFEFIYDLYRWNFLTSGTFTEVKARRLLLALEWVTTWEDRALWTWVRSSVWT